MRLAKAFPIALLIFFISQTVYSQQYPSRGPRAYPMRGAYDATFTRFEPNFLIQSYFPRNQITVIRNNEFQDPQQYSNVISSDSLFDFCTLQPLIRHYTDYAGEIRVRFAFGYPNNMMGVPGQKPTLPYAQYIELAYPIGLRIASDFSVTVRRGQELPALNNIETNVNILFGKERVLNDDEALYFQEIGNVVSDSDKYTAIAAIKAYGKNQKGETKFSIEELELYFLRKWVKKVFDQPEFWKYPGENTPAEKSKALEYLIENETALIETINKNEFNFVMEKYYVETRGQIKPMLVSVSEKSSVCSDRLCMALILEKKGSGVY